jgi:hypothetical protein
VTAQELQTLLDRGSPSLLMIPTVSSAASGLMSAQNTRAPSRAMAIVLC